MPHVPTRDFGTVDYEPSAELYFPRGLPGFEGHNRFVLMEHEQQAPIVFLQSITTPELCFLTVSVWAVDPGYQVGIADDDLETLGLNRQPQPADDFLCLSILAAKDDGTFTANLLAPVIVNRDTRVGLQAIRADARYSHCHPVLAGGTPDAEATPCL